MEKRKKFHLVVVERTLVHDELRNRRIRFLGVTTPGVDREILVTFSGDMISIFQMESVMQGLVGLRVFRCFKVPVTPRIPVRFDSHAHNVKFSVSFL